MTSDPGTNGASGAAGVGLGADAGRAAHESLLAERERVAALRDGVQRELSGEPENASLSELSDADQHPADVGTETAGRESDVSLIESLDAELADIEAALERLEGGTYGLCQACGRPISAERLDALPATRFCVADAELAAAEAAPGVAPLGPSSGRPLNDPGRAI